MDFGHTLKALLGAWLMPFPLAFTLLIGGTILLWLKHITGGRWLVTMGTALLLTFSAGNIAPNMIFALEKRFPKFEGHIDGLAFVIVMGETHSDNVRLPTTNEPNCEAMYRLAEGIAIYRSHPGSKLIFSGAGYKSNESHAQVMARVAILLRVPAQDIVTQNISRDTEEEVPLLGKIVGQSKFVVVTSAVHMTRTIELFHRQNLFPTAAPTAFLIRCCNYPDLWMTPSAENLELSASVMHEYLGLMWLRIKRLLPG